MTESNDPTRQWVDTYMRDPELKNRVASLIDKMIDPLTNPEALASALLTIGKNFRGNDKAIVKAVSRLYVGYLQRRK